VQFAKHFILCCVVLIVTGCALAQQVTLSPSTLLFGPQLLDLVSTGSPVQNVTLTNSGSANLIVTAIQASGGYKQSNNCTTVAPRASCTIAVSFVPGTLGNIKGAITITDNAPSNTQVVSLSGTGIAPVQLSAGSLNFGTVAVGTTSAPQSLTLTAAPHASVSINQVSVSGNFVQVNNCPATLASGQSCTISVVFHPTVSAAVTGAIAVSTQMNGNTDLAYSAALTGTGSGNVTSHVSVQPASLNFGNKGPDFGDTVKELTVTNTSSSTSLTIHNVSLAGSPNAVGAFPMYNINSNTCTGMLTPGAQCKIDIAFNTTFSRLFPHAYPAAVTITDTDPTNVQVVGISGNQVAELTFNPSTLVFAPQPVGTTVSKTVTVTGNDVQAGLVLDLMTSGDFSEAGDLSPCFAAPGAKCTMTVSFTPRQKGVINGSVTLETYPECNPFPLHQCSDPVILSLSGTGL
jgi:hypothetical protein